MFPGGFPVPVAVASAWIALGWGLAGSCDPSALTSREAPQPLLEWPVLGVVRPPWRWVPPWFPKLFGWVSGVSPPSRSFPAGGSGQAPSRTCARSRCAPPPVPALSAAPDAPQEPPGHPCWTSGAVPASGARAAVSGAVMPQREGWGWGRGEGAVRAAPGSGCALSSQNGRAFLRGFDGRTGLGRPEPSLVVGHLAAVRGGVVPPPSVCDVRNCRCEPGWGGVCAPAFAGS